MSEKTTSLSALPKAKGRDIGSGKDITLVKSQPVQLSLFRTFLNEDEETQNYSNTIELYDAVPKYFASKKQMAELREAGQFLPSLKRDFRHRGREYSVKITPARIEDKKNGGEREYYPSQREELIEEALKKIACDQLNGVFLNEIAGVQFTLYELRKELATRGHGIHLHDLVTSLQICRNSGIKITSTDGKNVLLDSSIFPVLVLSSRQEWEEDPKNTRCYVQFNPLITYSMKKLAYRQFDYVRFMNFSHQLSRWLFKRLSHNYTQASLADPYRIRLSTIIRDSALVNNSRLRDQVRYLDLTIQELKEKQVILTDQKKVIKGSRNKIQDVEYILTPHVHFISQAKKANRRQSLITEKGRQQGLTPLEESNFQTALWDRSNR